MNNDPPKQSKCCQKQLFLKFRTAHLKFRKSRRSRKEPQNTYFSKGARCVLLNPGVQPGEQNWGRSPPFAGGAVNPGQVHILTLKLILSPMECCSACCQKLFRNLGPWEDLVPCKDHGGLSVEIWKCSIIFFWNIFSTTKKYFFSIRFFLKLISCVRRIVL